MERLRAAGFRTGVASRGYGRGDEAQARWVDAGTPAELLAADGLYAHLYRMQFREGPGA